MGTGLRVLIVDDSEADASLLLRQLRGGGFEPAWERVDTMLGMSIALGRGPWEVVLSDYQMPRFSVPEALALLKEWKADIPLLVVSGAVGEERAVEAMRAGAADFIYKGNLARLVPAIQRELREAAVRRERAQMREQMVLSDRMVSVGTLAAGVAHEINNPLTVLIANLDFIAKDAEMLTPLVGAGVAAPAGDEPADLVQDLGKCVADARDAADRVRVIVRDLKVFSRVNEEELSRVDLRRVLDSSLRMAWNEIRHRARLVKDYGDVPLVLANEARLGQVFLNLVVNAAHAIPEGRLDENEIRVTAKADGADVVVEVRDTGSGIPAEIRTRIFEPFFTTKPIGVGTGLGLAICRKIVESLSGRIDLESEIGKGSVFRVSLPAARGGEEPAPSPAPPRPTRRARVMVVDDEAALGEAVRLMLAPDHEVTVATTAGAALRRLVGGERFDVILCDVMMPQLTGMDLHTEIQRVAPDQVDRVAFMTGGAFTPRAREFLSRVPNPQIEKPFDQQGLRELLSRTLRRDMSGPHQAAEPRTPEPAERAPHFTLPTVRPPGGEA
jgi:signal transduction histidine kinase